MASALLGPTTVLQALRSLPFELRTIVLQPASSAVLPLLPHTQLNRRTYTKMADDITPTSPPASRRLLQLQRSMAIVQSPKTHTRERIVILGSGWAGYILSRKLDLKKFDVTIVSPRSYFVFTPLLNDAAVGTLEFPLVVEPVRDRNSPINFIQGWARSVDFNNRTIAVEGSITDSGVTEAAAVGESEGQGEGFKTRAQKARKHEEVMSKIVELPYDKLIVSVGCISQTFGTKGVKENALFLKDVGDARKIRRRILECFELASMPNCEPEKRKMLLNFAAVGGGPTGMEFAAVLSDLIQEDMEKVYPSLRGLAKVTVYDVASKVLSMFDDALSKYAADTMRNQGVNVKTKHHPEELRWGPPGEKTKPDPKGPLTLVTKEEGEVGIGMCVWTTGNAMNPFVEHGLQRIREVHASDLKINDLKKGEDGTDHEHDFWTVKKHDKTGALLVDDHLRIQLTTNTGTSVSVKNIFAFGDNAMIESGTPPATAQTAAQEATWLAKRLNKGDMDSNGGFEFTNKGVMTYVGDSKGLVQTPEGKEDDASPLQRIVPDAIQGKAAYLAWKGVYWSMSVSWRNRILILVYWAINRVFGRDISRF